MNGALLLGKQYCSTVDKTEVTIDEGSGIARLGHISAQVATNHDPCLIIRFESLS